MAKKMPGSRAAAAPAPAGPPEKKSMKKMTQLGLRWSGPTAEYVYHLKVEQVVRIAAAAGKNRKGDRDELLVLILFDCCLRCSEALDVCPGDVEPVGAGWIVRVTRLEQPAS